MLRIPILTCRAVAALAMVLAALTAGCGVSGKTGFDRQELEQREDLSESLANDLLALSVAVRDRSAAVGDFFAGQVSSTPLPTDVPPAETTHPLVHIRHWETAAGLDTLPHAAFVERFQEFFGRLEPIEDARFKVKSADLRKDQGRAEIKFFVVGREPGGNREWLKGTASIEIRRKDDEPWRIGRFELGKLESKVTPQDLFSEVARPAGLRTVFPAFGVGRNQGFVSHGAAAADVDGDGLIDLATTGVDRNALYLNRGDGTFRDASEESLVGFAPTGSGLVFLDYDNDGDPDLFLAAVGRQVLLENRSVPDGRPRFWDVSEKAGVDLDAVGFSVVSADVDGNGFPDVYVCSYNHYGEVLPNSWVRATNGTPNLLFVNNGDGTFRESAAERGVDDGRWSYAAGFVDLDLDGDQDLYVANDFGENAMYRNDGDRFTDVAEELGIKDPGFGMGVAFGDYDNDGDLDLHVTNMSSTAGNRILQMLYPEGHELRQQLSKQAAGNNLYANNGDGTFSDATGKAGGFSGGWAFGGGFIDFDNDGREDIYTPNGFISGKSMKDT